MRYFYHPNFDDSILSEESSKHIIQVLRMKEGDQFLLTDGCGRVGKATIEKAHKKSCEISLAEIEERPYPKHEITLAISFTKNNSRMEWFLEKATEIGIREIIPILSHRSERETIKYERFHKILVSAMLQSQQSYLPVLREAMKLQAFLQTDYDNKFIAHCDPDFERQSLVDSLLSKDRMRSDMYSSCLLIGPEGDFTTLEIENALQYKFKAVQLGETRLRTETAGVVGAAILKNI